MNNWFEWNGERSTDYGMTVLSLPSIIMASERVSYETVPGKSGSLTLLEDENVFDDITLSCVCIIDDSYELVDEISEDRISKICGWLTGEGKVIFANRPEGFYEARIVNQVPFDQIVRGNPHRSIQIEFRCKPYYYFTSGLTPQLINSSPGTLTNVGNVPSMPLLKVIGTAEGTIMCGSSTVLINSFDGLDYIMLDCDAGIAYKGALGDALDPLVLLGSRVAGDWLTIPTGVSFLSFTSGITSVEVIPRWRSRG